MDQENSLGATQISGNPIINTGKMPGFIELAKEAIEKYKLIWKILIKLELVSWLAIFGFYLLMVLVAVLGTVAVSAGGSESFPVALGVFFLIAGLIGIMMLASWFTVATIVVLRDEKEALSVSEAMRRAKPFVLPYLLLSLLAGLITFAGILLFVVPGIIFGIWFMFWSFVLVTENIRGFDALQKSRNYVRGFFWNVFLLSLLAGLTSFFVSVFCQFLNVIPILGSLASMAISIFIVPLFTVFSYTMFCHLKKIKTGEAQVPPVVLGTDKNLALGLSIVGIIAVLGIIAAGVYFGPWIGDQITEQIDELKENNSFETPLVQ